MSNRNSVCNSARKSARKVARKSVRKSARKVASKSVDKVVKPTLAALNRQIVANTDSKIVNGIVRVVSRRSTAWIGSMTELSAVLSKTSTTSEWPENPRAWRASVDRVIPQLRRAGIKTKFGRTKDHDRKRFVTFTR